MNNNKILLLGTYIEGHFIVSLNNIIDQMVKNGATFLSYYDLYLKYGHSGAAAYINEYVKEHNIEIVIYDSAPTEFTLEPQFWENLRKKCLTVLMTGDTEHYIDARDKYYAQAMDYVISCDYTVPHKLGQLGIKAGMFIGYHDTATLDKKSGLNKDIDLSFVGTISGKVNRAFYLDHLRTNSFNVEAYGTGSSTGLITMDKKIEIYNRTKINLNLSGVAETTRLTRKQTIQRRMTGIKGNLVEAALCGGFVLSEYAYGIENVMDPGKEFIIFHNEDDLIEKTKYYLTHDKERNEIAERAYKRAHSDRRFDTKLAVEDFLADISKMKDEKRYRPSRIYLDEEFLRNFSTYRISLFLKFIKLKQFKAAVEEILLFFRYRLIDLYQARVFLTEEVLDSFPVIKNILKKFLKRK